MSINTFIPPDITNSTLWPEPTNAATNYRNQSTAQFTSVTNQLNTEVRDKVNVHFDETVSQQGFVTRDLSLTGTQTVALSFAAKSIIIKCLVSGQVFTSDGMCDEAMNQRSLYVRGTSTFGTIDKAIRMTADNANITDGTVTTIDGSGFTITWAHINSGSTGTAVVSYLATTH